MPTIPDKCEFEIGIDQIRLQTGTNGDTIVIKGIYLGDVSAAALAYLINHPDGKMKVVIKKATAL